MILRLLLANALELVTGLGVVSALGAPLGTSYLAGLAVVGIVSAHLALVDVGVGWIGLGVLAALGAAVTVRGRAWRSWRAPRPSVWAAAGLAALAALFVRAWPTFAAKPLDDYDGWAMWGMKAKALAELGWADPALFAAKSAGSLHLDYPLLLPSLDAVASRAMGGFDPRTIHLQFLLDAVAAFAAFASLLRDRVPAWLLWPWLVALGFAPALSGQLLTAYADVPLALFVAAGLLSAARWVRDRDVRTLALAALFLAAAALTKNEGAIFAAAAYFGLLLATRCWRRLLVAVAATELVLLPWQVWLHVYDVHSDTLLGLDALRVRHPGIAPLAVHGLLDRAGSLDDWPLLLPFFVLAVVAAVGTRVAVFAWAWALVSLLGLAWIYVVSKLEWSNYFAFSGNRVVDSVIVGTAALTPLLTAEALRKIAPP